VVPLLSLDKVHLSFWRGLSEARVLVDVSLRVERGQIVAVWGMQSQGKTTLLKVACGALTPSSGQVLLEGADVAEFSDSRRAKMMGRQVAWVDRSKPPIGRTILDYCAVPLLNRYGAEARPKAMAALRRVGIEAHAYEPWSALFDRERVLAGVAHGIARKPSLLLVDDLTENLTMAAGNEVIKLLRSIADERRAGILMTVSDLSGALRADELVTLGNGELLTPSVNDGAAGQVRPVDDDLGGRVVPFPGGNSQSDSE
jgi:ABC-type cobalamin/Fe3+-siderophores transport system ATPase subunit